MNFVREGEVSMMLSERLKMERKNKNLTQDEVAEVLKVSRTTISSWEVGRTYPDLDNLVLLSNLYEVTLDDLVRDDTKVVESAKKTMDVAKKWKYLALGAFAMMIPFASYYVYQKYYEEIDSAKQTETANLVAENIEPVNVPTNCVPFENFTKIEIKADGEYKDQPTAQFTFQLNRNYTFDTAYSYYTNNIQYIAIKQKYQASELVGEASIVEKFEVPLYIEVGSGKEINKVVLMQSTDPSSVNYEGIIDDENVGPHKVIWERKL